jgi:hypothetical protein
VTPASCLDTGVQTPPTDEGIKTDLGADEDRNRKGSPFQRLVDDEGGNHTISALHTESGTSSSEAAVRQHGTA